MKSGSLCFLLLLSLLLLASCSTSPILHEEDIATLGDDTGLDNSTTVFATKIFDVVSCSRCGDVKKVVDAKHWLLCRGGFVKNYLKGNASYFMQISDDRKTFTVWLRAGDNDLAPGDVKLSAIQLLVISPYATIPTLSQYSCWPTGRWLKANELGSNPPVDPTNSAPVRP